MSIEDYERISFWGPEWTAEHGAAISARIAPTPTGFLVNCGGGTFKLSADQLGPFFCEAHKARVLSIFEPAPPVEVPHLNLDLNVEL